MFILYIFALSSLVIVVVFVRAFAMRIRQALLILKKNLHVEMASFQMPNWQKANPISRIKNACAKLNDFLLKNQLFSFSAFILGTGAWLIIFGIRPTSGIAGAIVTKYPILLFGAMTYIIIWVLLRVLFPFRGLLRYFQLIIPLWVILGIVANYVLIISRKPDFLYVVIAIISVFCMIITLMRTLVLTGSKVEIPVIGTLAFLCTESFMLFIFGVFNLINNPAHLEIIQELVGPTLFVHILHYGAQFVFDFPPPKSVKDLFRFFQFMIGFFFHSIVLVYVMAYLADMFKRNESSFNYKILKKR